MGLGDTLALINTADGYRLTSHVQEFERQMEVARRGMAKNRHALLELAKR